MLFFIILAISYPLNVTLNQPANPVETLKQFNRPIPGPEKAISCLHVTSQY